MIEIEPGAWFFLAARAVEREKRIDDARIEFCAAAHMAFLGLDD